MNEFDRRRIAVASLVTVSVLSLVWVFSSGSSNGDGSTATTCIGCIDTTGNHAPSTTEYKPHPPIFFGGEEDETPQPDPVSIATAPEPNPNEIVTTTQFLRYGDTSGVRRCSTMLAPEGYELTVTNVNNGQSTTCTNTQGFEVPPGVGMVMDTVIFSEIGDLVDAPLAVRVSWEDESVDETVAA